MAIYRRVKVGGDFASLPSSDLACDLWDPPSSGTPSPHCIVPGSSLWPLRSSGPPCLCLADSTGPGRASGVGVPCDFLPDLCLGSRHVVSHEDLVSVPQVSCLPLVSPAL